VKQRIAAREASIAALAHKTVDDFLVENPKVAHEVNEAIRQGEYE